MAVFSAPALRYSDARGDEAPSMRKKSCFLGQRTPPGIWGRDLVVIQRFWGVGGW